MHADSHGTGSHGTGSHSTGSHSTGDSTSRTAAAAGRSVVPDRTGVSRRGLLCRSAVAGAGGLALASGWVLPALATNQATALRLGRHTRKTRVVVDLSDPPAYRLFTLADPARLVIDLLEADWLVPAGALPGATGHVGDVRFGVLDGGVTRIVLDLAEPVRVLEHFALSPREGYAWRLVVDLTETSARAFRADAGHENAVIAGPAADGAGRAATAPVPAPPPGPPSAVAPTSAQTPAPTASAPVNAAPTAAPAPIPPQPVRPRPAALAPRPPAATPRPTLTPAAYVPVPMRKPPAPYKPVIALDPGHGGRDPGAISVGGIYEKDITLAMGRELRKVLVGTGRYRVFMTRERDVSVRLRERVRRARQANADLFLSIHADALGNPRVRGLSVYTLSEKASDSEAAALAERENKADIILGMDFSQESPDVTNILIDLAQRETMNRSVQFANTLLRALPPEVRTLNHSRRYAGFAVLKAPDVPSALLEMGYLSNQTDEKLLRQRAYRAKLARSVVEALDGFFSAAHGVQGARLP